jgi:hypothetical protein
VECGLENIITFLPFTPPENPQNRTLHCFSSDENSTVCHCTVLYCTEQNLYCTVLYGKKSGEKRRPTVLYYTATNRVTTTSYYTLSKKTVLYCTVFIPKKSVLYCTVRPYTAVCTVRFSSLIHSAFLRPSVDSNKEQKTFKPRISGRGRVV